MSLAYGCRVHHPSINEAALVVKAAVDELRVQPYEEATGRGQLRYVQLTVGQSSPRDPACCVQVCRGVSGAG